MQRPLRLAVTDDVIGPVHRGHPWVYADAISERPAAGTPVQLVDGRGRTVAFGLADDGPIAVRVLDRHPAPLGRLLGQRVAAAVALRGQVVPAQTTAYRLLNGAGDGLPGVVVDRYGPLLVLRLYGACWVPHLERLVKALEAVPETQTVARRLGVRRVDGREGLETLAGPEAPARLVVEEAGLRFLVRPHEGQKTGLFLDQREHRRFVGERSRGLEVINLFAYTGGFTVHAIAGGARRVVSVDLAPEAMADAAENLRLNGMDPGQHGFEVADAFAWSPEAPADLVVSDPPSLTHGRKADAAARRAYRDLATHSGRMVRPGGLLTTASCTARLSLERWSEAVVQGLTKAGRWDWLWRAQEPPDHPVAAGHPEGHYLKLGLLRRRG